MVSGLAFGRELADTSSTTVLSEGYNAPRLQVQPSGELYSVGQEPTPHLDHLRGFFEKYGSEWSVLWDDRSDRPNLIEGSAVPLFPGPYNKLTAEEAGLDSERAPGRQDVERLVRGFLEQNPDLFHFSPENLVLSRSGSGNYGKEKEIWYITFDQYYQGLPVKGASLIFRIKRGDILQFGAEKLAEVNDLDPQPSIGEEEAFERALDAIGFNWPEIQSVDLDNAALEIYPVMAPDERVAEPYTKEPGQGYQHILAWRVAFQRFDDFRRYEAVIDAHTGEVFRFQDTNNYLDAQVTGGVFLNSYNDPNGEEQVNLPYVYVQNGASQLTTDPNGHYTYTPPSAYSNLAGKYAWVNSQCLPYPDPNPTPTPKIQALSDSNGNISFGVSDYNVYPNDPNNCLTPGFGGPGNTHAARTAYYHLTLANRWAATYLDDPNDPNQWIDGGTKALRINTESATYSCTGVGNSGGITVTKAELCTKDGVTDVFANTGEL